MYFHHIVLTFYYRRDHRWKNPIEIQIIKDNIHLQVGNFFCDQLNEFKLSVIVQHKVNNEYMKTCVFINKKDILSSFNCIFYD